MAHTCLWLQGGTYPARADRQLAHSLTGGIARVMGDGFAVSQSSPLALSVRVTAGALYVPGTTQQSQGSYLCHSDDVDTVVMPAAPGSNKRIDVIYAQVQDPNAGGSVGDTWVWGVAQGVVAASPVAPAVPSASVGSAVAVAHVLRSVGDSTVTNAMITDVAPRSGEVLFGFVSSSQPTGETAPGTIWFQT